MTPEEKAQKYRIFQFKHLQAQLGELNQVLHHPLFLPLTMKVQIKQLDNTQFIKLAYSCNMEEDIN